MLDSNSSVTGGQNTHTHLAQWTSTGLKDLPLIGGLCLAQRTLTTMGLRNLHLVGGHCLAQQTSTTMGLKDLPLVG